MTITITSTDQVTELNGVRLRIWDGVTERGTRCQVFVHAGTILLVGTRAASSDHLAVADESDRSQLEAELSAQAGPGSTGPQFVPLSKVN